MWNQSKNKKKKSKKYQPPDWGAIIDETRREIEISPFFEKFINKLPVDERISIICLGLGSITNSRSARHQLALLEAILMKNENFSLENLFDPAFTDEDLLILNQKFKNVAKEEFQGFQDDNSHRLLYLPHVPLWLLDDCIYKCRERLSNLIIIGNDMRTILETQNTIEKEELQSLNTILNNLENIKIASVENCWEAEPGAFNSLSITYFPENTNIDLDFERVSYSKDVKPDLDLTIF